MRRGTTPTHKFKLPFDVSSGVKDLRVTYKQDDKIMLDKGLEDCTFDGDNLLVYLSQEDTLKLKENVIIKVQIKALDASDNIRSHEPMLLYCKEILNEEILTGANGRASLDLIDVETFPDKVRDEKVYRTTIDGKTAIGTPNENGDKLFFEYKDGQWVDVTATEELSTLYAELAEKSATIATQAETIAQKETELAEKSVTIAGQTQTLARKEIDLAAKTATIEEQAQIIVEKETTIAEKTATIGEQTETIEEQSQTIATLENEKAGLTENVNVLTADIAEKSATIETQAQTIAENEAELTAKAATIEAQKTTIAEQVEELADKAETIEEQAQTIAEKQTTIESFNKGFPLVDELPNEVEEGAVYRVRVARTTPMETLFFIQDGACLPLSIYWEKAGFSSIAPYNEVKVEDIESITDYSNYPLFTVFIDTTTGIGYIFIEDEFAPGTIKRHTFGELTGVADKGKIHDTADATEYGVYYAEVYTQSGIAIANEILGTLVFIRRNGEWVNVLDCNITE